MKKLLMPAIAIFGFLVSQFVLVDCANADQVMYVVHGGANVGAAFGGEVGTVDLANGSYTTLSTPLPGVSLTGLAIANNQMFASTSQHSLATMGLNGSLISNVAFNGAGFDSGMGDRITDLTTMPNGTVYAAGRQFDTNGNLSDNLYTVDTATASLTLIGALPQNAAGFHAIAGGVSGNSPALYAHQTNGPLVFDEVDPMTGMSVSAISGGIPGGALGLGFNNADGLIYGSECCVGDDGGLGERLFSLDPNTGNAVLLFDYDDGRRIQDVAFTNAIPEPTSGLILFGGAMLVSIRRKRVRG